MNKMQMIAANSTLLSARPGPGDNANAVRRQFAQSAKPVDCRTADILPARCRHGTPVSFFPIFVHCSLVIGRSADAFGNTIIFSAPDTTGNWWGDAAVQSNYGANGVIYCGYRYDVETENYYVRNRTYNPVLGRWINRDPIGYEGGLGLYNYASGAPVGNLDPAGLKVIVVAFEGLFGAGRHPPFLQSWPYLKDFVDNYVHGSKYELKYYPEYSIGRAVTEVTPLLTKPIKGAKGSDCYNTVLVVGFSMGGSAALRFAGRLAQKGIKVNAGFTIDPIGQGPFWIWKSWNFFKPRTTKIWENFYQRGDNDLFGAFRGNPVQGAKNTQLHKSDFAWADFNFYAYQPKRHHSAGWFYGGAHTNGWILELSVVGNSFESLLSSIPARRRSYK